MEGALDPLDQPRRHRGAPPAFSDVTRLLLVGALMFVCAVARAQVDGGVPEDGGVPAVTQRELWGATIRELQVEVPTNVDRGTAEQLLGIKRGDRLEPAAIRRAVRRLALLGKLQDVRIYAVPLEEGEDAVRLVVQVEAAELVREVRFIGARDVPVAALRRDLPMSEGDIAETGALEASRRAVKRALEQEGYPDATVDAEFQPLPEAGNVALVFRIRQEQPQKIAAVRLVGDLRYPEVRLRDLMELPRGGLAARSRLEASAERLLNWYRSQGHYSARIEVEPIPVRSRTEEWVVLQLKVRAGPRWVVAFRGNNVFRSEYLKDRLGLPPDRTLDADLAAALEERVRRLYRDAGYYHARVQLRSAPGTEPGTRRMLFLIDEGPLTELGKVTLRGNSGKVPERTLINEALAAAAEPLPREGPLFQRLDDEDIDAILSSGDSERAETAPNIPPPQDEHTEYPRHWPWGLFGYPVDPEKVYDKERFELGARAMEDLLRSQGYLQPRVQGPEENFTLDGAQVDIRYNVNAGVQTRVHSVGFRGNEAISSSELLDLAGDAATPVEPGAPLNLFAVEQVRLALTELYQNRGYPFVSVVDDVVFSQDRTEADTSYIISEGPLVRVKKVVVRGNALTRDVLIRRQTDFKEGAPFRKRDVEEARRRLLNLGLFSSVNIELSAEEEGELRTVLVDVRERRFGELEFLVGASSEQGPRTSAQVSYRNVLGLGIVTGFRGRINWPYPTYFLIQNPDLRQNLFSRFDDVDVAEIPEPVQERLPENVANRLQEPPFPQIQDWVSDAVRPLLYTEFETVATAAYPRILFLPFDAGVRAELIAARANRLAFNMDKAGIIMTGEARGPSWRYLRASVAPSLQFQGTRLGCQTVVERGQDVVGRACAQDFAAETRRLDTGALALATLRLPVTLDGRDNIFRPHAGYLATGALDVVLGGGALYQGQSANCEALQDEGARETCRQQAEEDQRNQTTSLIPDLSKGQRVRSTFVRLAGGVSGYLPLTRLWTLALAARGGFIVPLGPLDESFYVPAFERFYLGGSDSVRGFTPDGVLASDVPDAQPDPNDPTRARPVVSAGGKAFWNLRSELRIPLGETFELGLFLDGGQLLDNPYFYENWDLAAFSLGTGFGLRINTPVGPLVFDIGFALKDGYWPFTPDDALRRVVLHPAIGFF